MTEEFNNNEMTQEEQQQQIAQEQRQEQEVQVKRVIAGVNDTFEKEYNFTDFDLKFTIRLKFPSLIDQGIISGETEKVFGGMGILANQQFYRAIHMLQIIQHQLKKYENNKEISIPAFLENVKEVYNPFILATIYKDFTDWMDEFQY